MTAQEALGQARSRWEALSGERRRLLMMAAAAVAIAGAAVVALTTYTPYTTVYTNLSPSAAGQVVSAIQQMKVPYQLGANGTSVSVPAADADQVRVTLATQNLPQTGQVGYQNVLNSIGFGMSDQQFNLAVLNALQQDLAGTVETMAGVRSAEVEIVEPAQSVFAAQTQGAAKASVYVSLAGSGGLPAQEVHGIVELVAHAVPGLSPQNVTVVDQYGQLLSQTSPAAGGATPDLAVQQSLESTLDQRLAALLTPVVGPGNVDATVNVALSFAHSSTVEQLTTNAGPKGTAVVAHRSSSSETFSGTGGAPVPAGTSGNVPTYAGSTGNGKSAYTTRQSSVQYALDHIERTSVSPPMTVTGVTAAILVNAKVFPGTAAHLAQVRSLVAGALGLTAAQAATAVAVQAVPFAGAPVPASPAPLLPSLPEVAAAAAALLILGLLLGLGTRRRRRTLLSPAGALPGPTQPIPVREAQAQLDAGLAREAHILEDISHQARTNPENVAELLRGWLREDA